jgi:2'-5' RNA ligase
LHRNLGAALAACDFDADQRPYSPHVSLLRKVRKTVVDHQAFSINWHVDRFVLLESISSAEGVNYRVIEEYPAQKL